MDLSQNLSQTLYPQPCLIQFDPRSLQRDEPALARGTYGVVFTGTAPGFHKKIVIKDITIQSNKTIDEWRKETQIMANNKSQFIAEVHGYSSTPTQLTIVMEYLPKGDLYNMIHRHADQHPLSILSRLRMARHCAHGVAFLHSKQIIHRDVKSFNILVSDDYSCKLSDFGCAKQIVSPHLLNTVRSGTPLWMAPEVRFGRYTFSADIYSLGLVFFEIFEKKLPNFDPNADRVLLPSQFHCASLVLPMVHPQPEARPTPQACVSVLDQMVNNIVSTLRSTLPKEAFEKLRQDSGTVGTPENETASIDKELAVLYRQLLTQPAHLVDAEIIKAFPIMNQRSPQPSSPQSPSWPQPPQTQVPAQAPPLPPHYSQMPPPYHPHQGQYPQQTAWAHPVPFHVPHQNRPPTYY